MGRIFNVLAFALLLAVSGHASQAQQVKLADGAWPSTDAYLQGTWKWERQDPRQTMIMRFERNGSFFFHNFTLDLQHWGRYRATGQQLAITLTRTCENKGSNCEDRSPPKDLQYAVTPTTANVFMANAERWERMK